MAEQREQHTLEHIMQIIKKERIHFINLEFTDMVGVAKCVTIPAEQLEDCVRYGKWFDGSAMENIARIVESDMYLYPDLSSFAILPGSLQTTSSLPGRSTRPIDVSDRIARVICDVREPDGERFDGDPRAALLRAIAKAEELGFTYHAAPELEFFLLQMQGGKPQPIKDDPGSYFDLSTSDTVIIRSEMVQALQSMGIKIDSSHHEVAAGQHEVDFETGDALRIADSLMTAKYIIKAIAAQHQLYATFLPKPFYGINGSGLHIHQQLLNISDGKNAFLDEQEEYGLSRIGRGFIAGQLAHAHSICAVLAPLVNSYKRLVRGYEAPVLVNWGRVNRQALIRVPQPGTSPQQSMRIELRCADPSCNPHLALAAMLWAGLDGIQRDLPLPPAMDENILLQDETERLHTRSEVLPATLGEALDALSEDTLIREALGDAIYEGFIDAKTIEWTEYRQRVHSWEIERYLPVF